MARTQKKSAVQRKVVRGAVVRKTSGATAVGPSVEGASAVDMAARTVALVVTYSGISNNRRVDTDEVTVDADKKMLVVTRQLIDHNRILPIWSLDGEAKRYLDRRALPSMLKRGVYLLPHELITEVEGRLTDFAARRRELVEELLVGYEDAKAEARTRLRGLFVEEEYPTADYIRSAFTLTWQYVSFSTPTSLQQINRALYEKERQKAEAMWAETRESIRQLLRQNLAELVSHLADKLTPDLKTGKRKKFKDSSFNKLQDFLNTLNVRDITDDAALRELSGKARQILEGVDVDDLREDARLQQTVRDGFAKIGTQLSRLIVARPTRMIDLGD